MQILNESALIRMGYLFQLLSPLFFACTECCSQIKHVMQCLVTNGVLGTYIALSILNSDAFRHVQ